MQEPLPNEQGFGELEKQENAPPPKRAAAGRAAPSTPMARVLGEEAPALDEPAATPAGPSVSAKLEGKPLEGKVLGTFRNTYYDFPSETDFEGAPVALKNARC